MPGSPLTLSEIMAPQYLLGHTLPAFLERLPDVLRVDELRSVYDDDSVLYVGTATVTGDGGAAPLLHVAPGDGSLLEWDDLQVQFRLLLPRDGARQIDDALGRLAEPPVNNTTLRALLDAFGPVEQNRASSVSTDFPGFAYRLELLVSTLTLHLSRDRWKPGKIENGRIVPDPELEGKESVRFVLPRMLFELTQPDSLTDTPAFHLKAWGASGFDAPSDLEAGEAVRMVPRLAIDKGGRWGFGVDQVLMDLSPNSTPPEILEMYGTDESFEGLFFKHLRLYFHDKGKDFGFSVGMQDWLLDFHGGDSFMLSADIFGRETRMDVAVTLYDGEERISFNPGSSTNGNEAELTGGNGAIPNTGVIQVHIQGGTPPYAIRVELDDGTAQSQLWDDARREALISPGMLASTPILRPPMRGSLKVTVADNSPTPKTWSMLLDPFTVTASAVAAEADGLPADRPASRPPALLRGVTPALPSGLSIQHAPAAAGTIETITISGPSVPVVTVNGTTVAPDEQGHFRIDVPAGPADAVVPLEIVFPAEPAHDEQFFLFFQKDRPHKDEVSGYVSGAINNDDRLSNASRVVLPSTAPSTWRRPGDDRGPEAFKRWLRDRLDHASVGPSVQIDAYASFESIPGRKGPDLELSKRRQAYAEALVKASGQATVGTSKAHGHTRAETAGHLDEPADRVVEVTGQVPASPDQTFTAELFRPATSAAPVAASPNTRKETPPAQPLQEPPPWFRRFGIELAVERGDLARLQLLGTIDLETELEAALRNASVAGANTLQLHQRPGGGASATVNEDGVIDFVLDVMQDPATSTWTEILALGSGDGDQNGLLEMSNPGPANNILKNALGALLVFAPIVNDAAAAFDAGSAGSWVALGGGLAGPVALGALDVFQTRTITLYGGSLLLREYLPDGAGDQLTDAALMFDYGVTFDVNLDLPFLKLHTTKPLKVRYRALGLNLHFPLDGQGGGSRVVYQPVFDTSKGYSLDLSDPGLFALPAPLGDLLEITAARIVRQNPLTIELDLGLKVDLGVVTVDEFRVRVPLLGPPNPLPPPRVLPTGVKVNLPGVLIGDGSLDIEDGKLSGSLDVTLTSVKLRIAAGLAVERKDDPTTGRSVTAVLATLAVDFPSPVVLLGSGLGLFGLSGLFGMHYKRLESPPAAGDGVSPALRWLARAGGDATTIEDPQGAPLWGIEPDRWSFGAGLLLGTLDGGFVVNMRGMFVLELPGPRILIFIRLKMLAERPGLKDAGGLITGIVGAIDLDLVRNTLTVSVVVDYKIEKLVAVSAPVNVFFNLKDGEDWRLQVGTFEAMVSADVLGAIQGRGYLMIGGKEIVLPVKDGPLTLPGIAVATGLQASTIIGEESSGLYLRAALGAHLGISISPFFLAGNIFFAGELRLYIVSIEASGTFTVEAPNPTSVHGKVCGHVSFYFFSVGGCVPFERGPSGPRTLPPPPLLTNVYLQSFAPVIVAGQGGDRPIDASLGNATELVKSGSGFERPDGVADVRVPIDSVIVLQLHGPPGVSWDENGTTQQTATFTEALTPAPGPPDDGWLPVGGGRYVRYVLKAIRLINGTFTSSTDPPPASWRPIAPPKTATSGTGPSTSTAGADTGLDLALFSRAPTSTPYALERSSELTGQVTIRWENLCTTVAPPACILWAFCGQPLGPSGSGWQINGDPTLDPPGTIRTSPPPTQMFVEEPSSSDEDELLDALGGPQAGQTFTPARIVGSTNAVTGIDKLTCERALRLPIQSTADSPPASPPVPPTDPLTTALTSRPDREWITFHTGQVLSASFLVAVPVTFTQQDGDLLVRQLDDTGATLAEASFQTFGPTAISGQNGLPDSWTGPASPWRDRVTVVSSFLESMTPPGLRVFFFTVKPGETCRRIQLAIQHQVQRAERFTVLVGALETCPQSEIDRAASAEEIRQGQVEALDGFVNGNEPVPLLVPNTPYTLAVEYDAIQRSPDGTETTTAGLEQQFSFRTDDKPPDSLGGRILACSPRHNSRFYFPSDPVKIVFNDLSAVQLYAAYDYKLRVSVRTADGVLVVPAEQPLETLDPTPAELSGPYRDVLVELIKGGFLPCTGQLTGPLHGTRNVAVELRPSMSYTLDLEGVPPDASGKARLPLARVSFTTSRFASLADLAADVRGRAVRHWALERPIAGLPLPAGAVSATVVADQEIEQALIAAGETALPPPHQSTVTVYWAPRANGRFAPHAVLIDTIEPVWRSCRRPELVTVPDQPDKSFQRAELADAPTLLVEESGGSRLKGLVRSPSGTRTLALFADGFMPAAPTGETVTLALRRPADSLFGLAEVTDTLVNVVLAARAPWEDDDA